LANDHSAAWGKILDGRLIELGKEHVFKMYAPAGNTPD
jgi:hypothetical protein